MNRINITTDRKFSATVVPNLFIDHYMPSANGTYVKVYLYLLRCLSGTGTAFTLSSAADALDETEKDLLRALSYWEKSGILSLEKTGDALSGITLLDLNHDTEDSVPAAQPKPAGTLISLEQHRKEMTEPKPAEAVTPPSYTEEELRKLREQSDLTFILNAVEVYLERLLTPQDINLVAYLHEGLSFSTDLILHLYEYCVGKNKKKWEYIEKVALSWHKEGIDTVEKAQEYSLMYDSCFNAVNKVFALGRLPIGPERDFIHRWSSFGFTPALIEEACNRTVLNTGKPDFKYADRILDNWHTAKVTSLADVRLLDADRSKQAKQDSARPAAPVTKSAANYNSYTQRPYSSEDFSALEDKLLKQM